MLVLSRKENESIVIDGHITITVVKIRGHQIRLGIEAPHGVPIRREELTKMGIRLPAATVLDCALTTA